MSAAEDVIGLVGLGNMGSRMARRLLDAGHTVLGYDLQPRAIDGLGSVEDIGTLAHESDTMVLSLPDGGVVADVCARIAATRDRRVTTVVDTSTIGPEAARLTFEALAAAGIQYVDAPVSGGIRGAELGTLSMMVATDEATFERLEAILAPIAQHRFRCGEAAGQGQAMKLLNNFLSATAMLATSEAVAFGVEHGLDRQLIVDVLNVSSGRNTASSDKFPRAVLTETWDYGFATRLMRKDVRLYAEHLDATHAEHAVGALVAETWGRFEDAAPDSDLTYIYEWVRQGGRLG